MGLFDKLFGKKKETLDFPPKPKWRPNLPIDIDAILDRAKFYTREKLQLAVFSHGTVVIFPDKVVDITNAGLGALDKIYNFHPDFKPMTMDDGNYLIEYSQPAFTIVFKEELEKYWDYIEQNHLDGLCTSEVLINEKGESNKFDTIGKICLFGRTKMFQDAQDPKVVRTYDPQR
jgi:hypothetical protein